LDEYVCLTVCGHEEESQDDFRKRLTEFWTFMLRNKPDDYETVYAETTKFMSVAGRVARQYMVEVDSAEMMVTIFSESGFMVEPFDLDDVYNKYEATSPDWFQIPHD